MNSSLVRTDRPFYLGNESRNVLKHLETELSIIPPELREGYLAVEDRVSKAFLDRYGKFLSDEQKEYFVERQVIFMDYETATDFSRYWETEMVSIDPAIAELSGEIYVGYSVGEPLRDRDAVYIESGQVARTYWAGRIAVFPLSKDEVFPISTDWLISDEDYLKKKEGMSTQERFESIQPYAYSVSIGAAVLHEKIHGVQDYRIPLPILEAAAHFYHRHIFEEEDWDVLIGSNMECFADYYGALVEELGEDLYRFIFGNLASVKEQRRILKVLKNRFSKKKIEELSTFSEFDWDPSTHRHIYWYTESIEEVKKEIVRQQAIRRLNQVGRK